MTPGRPMTFVVTQGFLDHFGLESERDLPGLAELRPAGLLDNDGSAGAAVRSGAGRRRPRRRRRWTEPLDGSHAGVFLL